MRLSCLSLIVAVLALASALSAQQETNLAGVQVWNVPQWETVQLGDYAWPNYKIDKLEPIDLICTRNAVCSGRVLVTNSNGAIRNLSASASELKQVGANATGRIAAEQILVRYADLARPEFSWVPTFRFDRLLPSAAKEIPVVTPTADRVFTPKNTTPVAMGAVWVTVRVPKDASAGDYEGVLTVQADDLAIKPVKVAIRVKVHPFVMPDPRDFRVRTIGWLNPEALATHYKAPLWSDRHFELIGQSMERMLELGSRHIQIDVTRQYPSRDNNDTMIKWIKQDDGSYKYDFTIFDKYCDLAARKIGKPFPIRMNLWRGPRNGGGGESDDYPNSIVLVLDPKTGQVTELDGPHKLGSEEMRAFWKPVMDEIRVRLEKRGWFDVTGPNWMCYCGGMTVPLLNMVKSIWPEAKWTDTTHGRVKFYKLNDKEQVPVFVQSTVWNEGTLKNYADWKSGPFPRNYAGWFQPATAYCSHARVQYGETARLWKYHTIHEESILKGNDGLECVGADHFPRKDSRGRIAVGLWSAFAQGPKNATLTMLGAGPDGVVGTERFEAMREGIQLCEAMVFIQKAIEAKKLTGPLLDRANKVLDDRAKAMVASYTFPTAKNARAVQDLGVYAKAWRERDNELFVVAAEVAEQK